MLINVGNRNNLHIIVSFNLDIGWLLDEVNTRPVKVTFLSKNTIKWKYYCTSYEKKYSWLEYFNMWKGNIKKTYKNETNFLLYPITQKSQTWRWRASQTINIHIMLISRVSFLNQLLGRFKMTEGLRFI